jgi:phosphoadenosine phosphosulfate reductase
MILENKAIKFIKTIHRNMPNLHSGNSGGKDSAVVDKLIELAGVRTEVNSYYTNTTIDPPKTISHIRNNYPHTEILQPKETFFQLVERKGLPTRLNRYCCEFLKEYGSVGKNVFEGIRSAEGRKRQGRDYVQCDNRKWQKGSQHIYPIYDWQDVDVYEFIDKYNIELAPHYKTGACRLGCVGCPLVSRKGARQAEFDLYPKYYTAIKKAITKGMAKNPQWKLTCATDGDGELAMQWWLSGKTMNEFFNLYSFEKTEAGWQKNI